MIRKFLKFLLLLVVILGIGFALGPREEADLKTSFDEASIGTDIDAYLAKQEAGFTDIKPGAQKQMIWFDPATKSKQPYSIVYLHGFSATLAEIRPVPDLMAKELGANIFYTRFQGHGRSGDAMAEGTVNGWMNDVAEALAIGRATGEEVIVVSTSTGGTLAALAATRPSLMKNVKATVMVAPNFAVQAAGAEILSLPWARQFVPYIAGEYREWQPKNEAQGQWWSTRYPMVSLLPLQASVTAAGAVEFEELTVPALTFLHLEDGVVKSDVTAQIMSRWGKNNKVKVEVIEITDSDDTMNHVIAGDILSPQNNQTVADKAVAWIRSL